jgi:hypothetical protein
MAKGTPGFDTTGKVHHEGKKNEVFTQKALVFHGYASDKIELLGRTKNKADLLDPHSHLLDGKGRKKVSCKQKQDITKGSFDWINTSKVYDVVGDTFVPFLDQIQEYRQNLSESQRSSISFVKQVRKEFANLCSGVLDSFTAEQLTSFIQLNLIDCNVDSNESLRLTVTDVATKKLYLFDTDKHPAFEYIGNGFVPFLKGRAKGSRRLLFADGQKEYDCGLRIRVTNNNGIKAFLGVSEANKNSQVVFKLQQDKIKKLLDEVGAEVLDTSMVTF